MRVHGRLVLLDGNEVATAIDAYLVAHGVAVVGPRTVTVKVEDCGMHYHGLIQGGEVYVDPSGRVVDNRPISDPGDPTHAPASSEDS